MRDTYTIPSIHPSSLLFPGFLSLALSLSLSHRIESEMSKRHEQTTCAEEMSRG